MADADIRISARDDTRAAFDAIRRNFSDLQNSAVGVRTALGGIAAGVGVGALANLVRESINAADELNKLSQKAGVSVESLSRLQYAAKLSDVSTEALATGLRNLNKNIDGNETSFARLGVALRDTSGNVRSTEAVLGDVAEAFAELPDSAAKSALALRLFGKTGTDLIPLLNAGRAGLKDFGDEAQRLGLVITADTARAAEAFNDNITRLGASASSAGISIANELLPSLVEFSAELVEGRRIFGDYKKALFALGTENPFRSQSEGIRALGNEIEALQKKLGTIKPGAQAFGFRGDTLLGGDDPERDKKASITAQIEALKKRREFLEFQQRQGIATGGADTLDARDLALRRRRNLDLPSDKPRDNSKESDRENLRIAQEIGRRTAAEAADKAAVAAATNQVENYEPQAKRLAEELKKTSEEASILFKILSGTPTAALEDLQTQQNVLNKALVDGKINAYQFTEAFDVIDQTREQVLGRTKSGFTRVADDGSKAFEKIENAVRGFGDRFARTLADGAQEGKLEFASLADSIISDILRITIQRSITTPLLEAGAGALSGFFGGKGAAVPKINFGGAGASGGDLTGGTAYLVGELGRELFVPATNGRLVPNNQVGGAGGGPVFNVSIGAGVDRAQVMLAMRQATAMAKADIARARRLGPSPY